MYVQRDKNGKVAIDGYLFIIGIGLFCKIPYHIFMTISYVGMHAGFPTYNAEAGKSALVFYIILLFFVFGYTIYLIKSFLRKHFNFIKHYIISGSICYVCFALSFLTFISRLNLIIQSKYQPAPSSAYLEIFAAELGAPFTITFIPFVLFVINCIYLLHSERAKLTFSDSSYPAPAPGPDVVSKPKSPYSPPSPTATAAPQQAQPSRPEPSTPPRPTSAPSPRPSPPQPQPPGAVVWLLSLVVAGMIGAALAIGLGKSKSPQPSSPSSTVSRPEPAPPPVVSRPQPTPAPSTLPKSTQAPFTTTAPVTPSWKVQQRNDAETLFGADPQTCQWVQDPNLAQAPLEVTPTRMSLAGTEVRAFNTRFNHPFSEEDGAYIQGQALPVQSTIKADLLSQLDFYGLPMYFFLGGDDLGVTLAVPKGWRPVDGRIGVNGSAVLLFKPQTGPGYLSFYQASVCLDCAFGKAAPLFPEALQQCEREYGVGRCTPLNSLPVQQVKLKPHLVGYRLEGRSGNRMDGVAYFDPGIPTEPYFWSADICLPAAQQHLGNPVLNRFLSIYRRK